MARTYQGITQAELSKAVGVDPAVICKIEAGQLRMTPRVIQAQRLIAEFLKVPVETLFPEK
jgi:DNA-binding XRE family transcriptional regulator